MFCVIASRLFSSQGPGTGPGISSGCRPPPLKSRRCRRFLIVLSNTSGGIDLRDHRVAAAAGEEERQNRVELPQKSRPKRPARRPRAAARPQGRACRAPGSPRQTARGRRGRSFLRVKSRGSRGAGPARFPSIRASARPSTRAAASGEPAAQLGQRVFILVLEDGRDARQNLLAGEEGFLPGVGRLLDEPFLRDQLLALPAVELP